VLDYICSDMFLASLLFLFESIYIGTEVLHNSSLEGQKLCIQNCAGIMEFK
jgi:hypothetical protein